MHVYSGQDAAYRAPEIEVTSLEAGQILAASGTFSTDPWNYGNGNSELCS